MMDVAVGARRRWGGHVQDERDGIPLILLRSAA